MPAYSKKKAQGVLFPFKKLIHKSIPILNLYRKVLTEQKNADIVKKEETGVVNLLMAELFKVKLILPGNLELNSFFAGVSKSEAFANILDQSLFA